MEPLEWVVSFVIEVYILEVSFQFFSITPSHPFGLISFFSKASPTLNSRMETIMFNTSSCLFGGALLALVALVTYDRLPVILKELSCRTEEAKVRTQKPSSGPICPERLYRLPFRKVLRRLRHLPSH